MQFRSYRIKLRQGCDSVLEAMLKRKPSRDTIKDIGSTGEYRRYRVFNTEIRVPLGNDPLNDFILVQLKSKNATERVVENLKKYVYSDVYLAGGTEKHAQAD